MTMCHIVDIGCRGIYNSVAIPEVRNARLLNNAASYHCLALWHRMMLNKYHRRFKVYFTPKSHEKNH